MKRLDWNEFQRLHKGQGWTKQEMSNAWKEYKQHDSRQYTGISAFCAGYVVPEGAQRGPADVSRSAKQDSTTSQHRHMAQSQQQPQQSAQGADTAPLSSPIPSIKWEDSPAPKQQAADTFSRTAGYTGSSRPSVTPSPGSRLPPEEVAKLRAAVDVALSARKPVQHISGLAAVPIPFTLDAADSNDRPTLHNDSSISATTGGNRSFSDAAYSGPQQPLQHVVVSVGCFGLQRSGQLAWNGFQKLCKGKGMKQAEQSAAWKHYKKTGQLPIQLQQQLDALQAGTAPKQDTTLQQQRPNRLAIAKEWVVSHSRASSRAVSRAVSRTVSRAVSRAVSRVGSPDVSPNCSPGAKVTSRPQQGLYHKLQRLTCHSTGLPANYSDNQGTSVQAKHAVVAAAQAFDSPKVETSSCCLTEQLLEPDGKLDQWQQQQQDMLEVQLVEALQQQQQQLRRPRQQWLQPAADAGLAAQQVWQWPIAADMSGHLMQLVGGRQVREFVPDDLPDLFAGFSAWTPVSITPAILRQLKKKIPAAPGVYEWGARMPVIASTAVTASTAGTAGLESAGAAAVFTVQYGPVSCFYMGKAGEDQSRELQLCHPSMQLL